MDSTFNETFFALGPDFFLLANVWAITAPKMERAPIFMHVASEILENASQEAENFEKWWRG